MSAASAAAQRAAPASSSARRSASRRSTVSSFFRVYRASVLRRSFAHYGDDLMRERGFACKAEMLANIAASARGSPRFRSTSTATAAWARARCRSSGRSSPTGACSRGSAATEATSWSGTSYEPAVGRHRRRRHPRDDCRVPSRAGGRPGRALRARDDLGGLVGSFDFDGRRVDRFYHVILPTDDRVIGLAEELGLGDRFRFRPTKVGFYDGGRLFSMTSPKEFLTFPLLRPWERARLAAFVARCQLKSTYDDLDQVPLQDWLRRLCGRRVVDQLLAPAARLEVRRALRRPSGDLHLGADAPHVEDARQGRPGDHGLARRAATRR